MNQPLPTQPIEMSPEELKYWQGWIKASLRRQKTEFIERIGYSELIKYLEGQQSPAGATYCIIDDWSPAILSVVTSVYYQNPTVQVEAATPEADKPVSPSIIYMLTHPDFVPFHKRDLLRGAIIHSMNKSGMKEEMQIGAFDLMLAGFACIEENHTVVGQDETLDDKPVYAGQETLTKMVDGVKGFFDKLTGSKSEDETEEDVAANTQGDIYTDSSFRSYTKRWNPLDILFDPRAKVFKESRAIGKRIKMTVAEFNVKYPKFKGKVTAYSKENDDLMYADAYNKDDNKKCVTLYELEIKKKGPRNCILVTHLSIDEPIDYYERPIITNDFAIKYGCIDNYGVIYPMSRGKKAKAPQDNINHYMTIQFEHVDRAPRKIGVYFAGLTESGKAAQRSNDVYAIVEKQTPQAIYEPMPAPQVVPENKELVMANREALNKAIGTNELAKTGDSENDTLGQDELQAQAFQVNVNAVQDAMQGIADQILDAKKDVILQLWDEQDYFKVTGIKGGDAWYDPSMGPLADILIGDYDVQCNITSAMRPNPAQDRKNLTEMTAFVTSPNIMQFAMMHGKRPTMEPLDNYVKQFGMNPDMVFEDIAPPQGMPPAPTNANIVQADGSRMIPGAPQGGPLVQEAGNLP